jgi:phage terminase large subunit-like protein
MREKTAAGSSIPTLKAAGSIEAAFLQTLGEAENYSGLRIEAQLNLLHSRGR